MGNQRGARTPEQLDFYYRLFPSTPRVVQPEEREVNLLPPTYTSSRASSLSEQHAASFVRPFLPETIAGSVPNWLSARVGGSLLRKGYEMGMGIRYVGELPRYTIAEAVASEFATGTPEAISDMFAAGVRVGPYCSVDPVPSPEECAKGPVERLVHYSRGIGLWVPPGYFDQAA